MLSKLRRRAQDEQGFTLIELLVVILIIGILAAVAIPTFLNQRGKAYDSNAQSMVKNAQIAEETYATANNGAYTTDPTQLISIDPSLGDTSAGTLVVDSAGSTGYVLQVTAANTSDVFTLSDISGVQTDKCTNGGGGGSPGACTSAGTW